MKEATKNIVLLIIWVAAAAVSTFLIREVRPTPHEAVVSAIEADQAYYHPKTGELVWRKCEVVK